jgi:hypothetical protein
MTTPVAPDRAFCTEVSIRASQSHVCDTSVRIWRWSQAAQLTAGGATAWRGRP